MSIINTNLNAMSAVRSSNRVQTELAMITQQLSTGRRVSSASDDPSALVGGTLLTKQIIGTERAIANINDGISMMQVADGGLASMSALLTRAKELSVQAANGTLSDSDRGTLNAEFQEIKRALDDLANGTVFNEVQVLKGELVDIEHPNDSVVSGQVTLTDTPADGLYTLYINATPVTVSMVQDERVYDRLVKVEAAVNALTQTHGVTAVIQGDALSLVGNPSSVSAWYDSNVPGLSAASFGLQLNTVTASAVVDLNAVSEFQPVFEETDTYIEWRDGGSIDEDLWLSEDASPLVTADQISIVNGTVYRGDGQNAVVVGRVDATLNGQSGQALRVWRELGGFANGGFNNGTRGSATIDGWTVENRQVFLNGQDSLAGLPTAQDTTTAPDGGQELPGAPTSTPNFDTKLTASGQYSGDLSVELRSSMTAGVYNYPNGSGGVVHGPAIYSNNAVTLSAGDTVSFDWMAQGGSDAYDVYAYIVNEDTGRYEVMLDATGDSSTARTSWTTVTHSVQQAGRYKFVFVSGTWDASKGQAAGAQLYIDNVQTSADVRADTALSAQDITDIRGRINYSNSNPYAASLSINGEVFSAQSNNGRDDLLNTLAVDIQAKIDDGTLGDLLLQVSGRQMSLWSNTSGKQVDIDNLVSSVNVELTASSSSSGPLVDEDVWGIPDGNTQSTGFKTADGGSYFTYGTGPLQLRFQVGAQPDNIILYDVDNLSADGQLLGIVTGDLVDDTLDINIGSQGNANDMSAILDQALSAVSDVQAKVGAMISRFVYSADKLAGDVEQIATARSKIVDTDYAFASTEMVRLQIINQASTELISQSTQLQKLVLQLVSNTPRGQG